jgi:hypothetical protein
VRRVAPWALVAFAALAYPLAVLAFSGAPDFPSHDDCSPHVTDEGELEVVFGYRESELQARALQRRVLALGFTGTEIEPDGCGRVRVSVDDIPSREIGEEVVREAQAVGLEPTLEQET